MKLFLDTEFDGFRGNLISMALVPEEEDRIEWYEVLQNLIVDEWCRENVLPKLEKEAIGYKAMLKSLDHYLAQFKDITIVCDWPDDIRYFCDFLVTGPGIRIGGNIKFELWDSPPYPDNPMRHNARVDAMTLRDLYLISEIRQPT